MVLLIVTIKKKTFLHYKIKTFFGFTVNSQQYQNKMSVTLLLKVTVNILSLNIKPLLVTALLLLHIHGLLYASLGLLPRFVLLVPLGNRSLTTTMRSPDTRNPR